MIQKTVHNEPCTTYLVVSMKLGHTHKIKTYSISNKSPMPVGREVLECIVKGRKGRKEEQGTQDKREAAVAMGNGHRCVRFRSRANIQGKWQFNVHKARHRRVNFCSVRSECVRSIM